MNTQLVKVGMKAGKILKGSIPFIGAGFTAVMEVVKDQKAAAHIKNLEDRIVELEKLIQK